MLTKNHRPSILVVCSVIACGCFGKIDYAPASIVPSELATDGVLRTGVLAVVNDRTMTVDAYERAVGLSPRTAEAIVTTRNGANREAESTMVDGALVRAGDDIVFATLLDVAVLPEMEASSFDRLQAYAVARGYAIEARVGFDRLYWAEANSLKSSNLDGTDVTTLFTATYPTSIVVDGLTRRVFWSDNGNDTISSANLDGQAPQLLYAESTITANPEAIALDTTNRIVFFTMQGSGNVMSAALDGSRPKVIATGSHPAGIAIDFDKQQIYFSDNGTDEIVRMSYDGSNRATIHRSGALANPRSLVVDSVHRDLFWTEGTYLQKMSLDDTAKPPLTILEDVTADGLALDEQSGSLYVTTTIGEDDAIVRTNLDGSARTVIYRNTDKMANPRRLFVLQ